MTDTDDEDTPSFRSTDEEIAISRVDTRPLPVLEGDRVAIERYVRERLLEQENANVKAHHRCSIRCNIALGAAVSAVIVQIIRLIAVYG